MAKALDLNRAFELFDRLGHAYALMQEEADSLAARYGVSGAQLVALLVLLAQPNAISQTELARLTGVSRQRAHVVTRSLELAHYVQSDPRGRVVDVSLTKSGRHIARQLRNATARRAIRRLRGLSGADAAQLHRGLGQLLDCLEATRG